MGSVFGNKIKYSLFGESHGKSVGITIDGFPCGVRLNLENLTKECNRRKPGGEFSTKRNETDTFEFISGVLNQVTTGAPICAIFNNNDTHSSDYEYLKAIPRPSHSDYSAFVKYNGYNDIRGGGHFSARLTAPIVLAGAMCKQLLMNQNIVIASHIYKLKNIYDDSFNTLNNENYEMICEKPFPVINDCKGELIKEEINCAKSRGDSVGGVAEIGIYGLKSGIGDPFFNSIESVISHMMFSIPAVKGVEFGDGFKVSDNYGSENNDCYYKDEKGIIKTKTNHCGGICGGISNGMPIIFRVAFKPTPSIYLPQNTLNIKTGNNEELIIKGRHDPCVLVRGIPVCESATAMALTDLIL